MDIMRLLLSCLAALVISTPILTVLRNKKIVGAKPERIIAQAQAAGRVVTAVRERAVQTVGDPGASTRRGRSRLWLCTYGYMVDGKRYTMHTQSEEEPPQKIELFYPANRPGKPVYRGKPDRSGTNVFFAVLPVLVWAVFYNFVFR